MAIPRGVESGLDRARALQEKMTRTVTKIERDATLHEVMDGLEETREETYKAIQEMERTLDEVETLIESLQDEEGAREDLKTIQREANSLKENWSGAKSELTKIVAQIARITTKINKNALEGFFKDETNAPLEGIGISIDEMNILMHADEADQEKLMKTYFSEDDMAEWEEMRKERITLLGFLDKKLLGCPDISMRNKAIASIFIEDANSKNEIPVDIDATKLKHAAEKALEVLTQAGEELKKQGFEIVFLLPKRLTAIRIEGDKKISVAINEYNYNRSKFRKFKRFFNDDPDNATNKNYEASVMISFVDDKDHEEPTGFENFQSYDEDRLVDSINAESITETTKEAFRKLEEAIQAREEANKESEELEKNESLNGIGISINEINSILHASPKERPELLKSLLTDRELADWEEKRKAEYTLERNLSERIHKEYNTKLRNKALADLFVESRILENPGAEFEDERIEQAKKDAEKALAVYTKIEEELDEQGFEEITVSPTGLFAKRTEGDMVVTVAIHEKFGGMETFNGIGRFSKDHKKEREQGYLIPKNNDSDGWYEYSLGVSKKGKNRNDLQGISYLETDGDYNPDESVSLKFTPELIKKATEDAIQNLKEQEQKTS